MGTKRRKIIYLEFHWKSWNNLDWSIVRNDFGDAGFFVYEKLGLNFFSEEELFFLSSNSTIKNYHLLILKLDKPQNLVTLINIYYFSNSTQYLYLIDVFFKL